MREHFYRTGRGFYRTCVLRGKKIEQIVPVETGNLRLAEDMTNLRHQQKPIHGDLTGHDEIIAYISPLLVIGLINGLRDGRAYSQGVHLRFVSRNGQSNVCHAHR